MAADYRCEECRWWDNSVTLSDDLTTGLCRAKPPRADNRGHRAVWPFTHDEDWCAHFTAPPEMAASGESTEGEKR